MVRSLIVLAALALSSCVLIPGCPTAQGVPAEGGNEAIPARSGQLLAPLPDPAGDALVRSLQEWVAWPDEAFVAAHRALRDRSAEIPPVYPDTDLEDAKPLRPGAKAPPMALPEAARWIRRVVREEWVPGDLEAKLIPLQLDPASRSVVLCRFDLRHNHFQIAQSRAGLCVVVRPADDGARSPETAGPQVFRTFFMHGTEMADLRARAAPFAPEGLHVFLPDNAQPWPDEARVNWWGWRLWYTDGQAVAVFMHKVADSQRPPSPDDPWF